MKGGGQVKWIPPEKTTLKKPSLLLGLTLVGKAKKDYYNNLDHQNNIDNKTFWKFIKPLFSEKSSTHNKITFVKQGLILDKNDNVAEVLNNFFTKAVSNLNIPKYHDKSVNIDHIEDSTARSIKQC